MTEKDLSQKIDWSITSLYTKVAIGLLITTTILPLTVKGFSEILNKIWHFNEPGSPSIQFGDQPIVLDSFPQGECVGGNTIDMDSNHTLISREGKIYILDNYLNIPVDLYDIDSISFYDFSISPDRNHASYRDQAQGIFLLDLESNTEIKIGQNTFVYGWNGNNSVFVKGNSIRTTAADGGYLTNGINIMDLEGQETILTDGIYGAYSPKTSPRGTDIAFLNVTDVRDKTFMMDIYIIDSVTREERPVTSGMRVANLEWSPDGNQFAFTDDYGNLYTINSDGSGIRQIDKGLALPAPRWIQNDLLIYHKEITQNKVDVYRYNPEDNEINLFITGGDRLQLWDMNNTTGYLRNYGGPNCDGIYLLDFKTGGLSAVNQTLFNYKPK